MYKIVKKQQASARQITPKYTVFNYITKDISKDMSLAVGKGDNFVDKVTTKENRIYYVVKGQLILHIGNDKIVLDQGDACFIPENTSYKMKGTFVAVIVNQPAFGVMKSLRY